MIITKTPDGWIVVLRPDNLARMKVGDPVTIPDLNLTICFEEISDKALYEKLTGVDPRPYLLRGWQNHPGDYKPWEKL